METRIIKISLIVAFLTCLFSMPYWYYQLIRLLGTIGLGYIAYLEQKNGRKPWVYLFIISAVIFNPIIKISFEESIFKIIDVILSACIMLSMIPSLNYITIAIFPKLFRKKLLILSVFMVIGLMVVGGYYLVQYIKAWQLEKKVKSIELEYTESIKTYNKRCPFEINSDIRCDSVRFNAKGWYVEAFYTITSFNGIANNSDPRVKLFKYLVDNYSNRKDMSPISSLLYYANEDLGSFIFKLDNYEDRMTLYNYLLEEKLVKGSFSDFSKNLFSNNSYNDENKVISSLEYERMQNYVQHNSNLFYLADRNIWWSLTFMDKDKYKIVTEFWDHY